MLWFFGGCVVLVCGLYGCSGVVLVIFVGGRVVCGLIGFVCFMWYECLRSEGLVRWWRVSRVFHGFFEGWVFHGLFLPCWVGSCHCNQRHCVFGLFLPGSDHRLWCGLVVPVLGVVRLEGVLRWPWSLLGGEGWSLM